MLMNKYVNFSNGIFFSSDFRNTDSCGGLPEHYQWACGKQLQLLHCMMGNVVLILFCQPF